MAIPLRIPPAGTERLGEATFSTSAGSSGSGSWGDLSPDEVAALLDALSVNRGADVERAWVRQIYDLHDDGAIPRRRWSV
ncbi:MAG: hypothetical protein IPK13_16200 [Deltaproteobacteria bacterium]|nr:hypothetical protein [Deltaproteobacteria bacterium]